jgi:hypothetical protein
VPEGFDLRPTELEHTPPRSPRARGRARSASPSSVPQRPSTAEFRDRNRSTHSNRTDTKGDFSDVVRDRDIPVVDSSVTRWATSSKAHSDETRHIQHTSTGVTGVESASEDGSMLLRSYSSRGRNRERETVSGVADGRQNLNQGQNLPASSTLSASNHLPLHLSYHRTAAGTALVQSVFASWVLPMGLVKALRFCRYLHVYVLPASIYPTDSMALVLDSICSFPISRFPFR